MSDAGKVFENIYSDRKLFEYLFDQGDLLGKYVRQRRATIALKLLRRALPDLGSMDCLFVCGGAGEAARLFVEGGLRKVTLSDISESALKIAKEFEPRLETMVIDAERLNLPDDAFDILVVQDGLHHLPSPPGALAEMLRIARRAVVIMEPGSGLVSWLLGREYEHLGGRVSNYVFRWDRRTFRQVVRSRLLDRPCTISFRRIWHHTVVLPRIGRVLGRGRMAIALVRLMGFLMKVLFPFGGNQVIAIVFMESGKPEGGSR